MTRLASIALTSAVLGYLGLVGLVAAYQRRLVFPAPPPRSWPAIPGLVHLQISGAHDPVFAAYEPPQEAGLPTAVYFHGNGEQLSDLASDIQWLHGLGLGVLAVEYPGYGLAHAQAPSEQVLCDAAEAALVYLRDAMKVDSDKVVLVGRSLGTGVAAEMARRGFGRRLVLVSPYTSMADMAALVMPMFPGKWLLLDRFDTASKANQIRQEVLIVHGDQDEVIPVAMGKSLAALFSQSKLVVIPGGHHNGLFGPKTELMRAIASFAHGP